MRWCLAMFAYRSLSIGWQKGSGLLEAIVYSLQAVCFFTGPSPPQRFFFVLVFRLRRHMAAESSEAEEETVRRGAILGPCGVAGLGQSEPDVVQQLREQQVALNQRKKLLTRQWKNEQRKKQRLRDRAKKLSNEDLVRVLCERDVQAKAKAKPKAQPKAKSMPS